MDAVYTLSWYIEACSVFFQTYMITMEKKESNFKADELYIAEISAIVFQRLFRAVKHALFSYKFSGFHQVLSLVELVLLMDFLYYHLVDGEKDSDKKKTIRQRGNR